MPAIFNLTARITTKSERVSDVEELVRTSLLDHDGMIVNQLKLSENNPKQSRIVRAALDLLAEKLSEMDMSAEEHLMAYSLTADDVTKRDISDVINRLFP